VSFDIVWSAYEKRVHKIEILDISSDAEEISQDVLDKWHFST